MKIGRALGKGWMKLVGRRNSEFNKRFGVIMVDSILKCKARGAKYLGLRVLKEHSGYVGRMGKYFSFLRRIENKFQKKFKR